MKTKKKWKSIRNSYQRLKKNLKIGHCLGCLKKSKQNRHVQLSFLDNVPHHRAGGTNVIPLQQELDVNNENVGVDEQKQDSDTTLSSNNAEQSNTGQEVEVGTDCTGTTEKVSNVVQAATPKKKEEERKHIFKTLETKRRKRQPLYKNMVRRMDDDIDLFCRHIGKVLRNLPPYEKAKAKKHLGEVLSDYEIMAASHSSGRRISSSLSNSTSNDRASTSSGLYTSSPPHSQHFIRSNSPLHRTTVSPVHFGQGNAPGNFQFDAYSPGFSTAASPGPSGTTCGQGCFPGPVHILYANSPMSTEVASPQPADLSFRDDQIDQEEVHHLVDTVGLNLL